MFTAAISILISVSIGVGLYFFTRKTSGEYQISFRELLIGSAVSSVVLMIAAPVAEHLIIQNKLTYYEYYNGYETEAIKVVTECERDGRCNNTYECDPYPETEVYYDDEGDAHYRVVIKYHDCPYLQNEYSYKIATTLGTFNIPGTFADHTRAAYRDNKAVPDYISTGPPQEWIDARDRIATGKNGGATKLHEYKNFLLASDKTILASYSQDIEEYKSKQMLPDHTSGYENPIYSTYLADKFRSVNMPEINSSEWNVYLTRLNGYLGKELQGDVHMVAVSANDVKDRDRYSQALFAYWKSNEFGKYALPKNAIALVVGVKDGKVEWARASGGLPNGNEALFSEINSSLNGVEFSPDKLIGIPSGAGKDFKAGDGALAKSLFGVNKYQRPCMECIDEQSDGYNYLKSDVLVSGSQKFWIIFVATIFSIGTWAAFLYADDRAGKYYGYNR